MFDFRKGNIEVGEIEETSVKIDNSDKKIVEVCCLRDGDGGEECATNNIVRRNFA